MEPKHDDHPLSVLTGMAAMQEERVRKGEVAPKNEQEERWAREGWRGAENLEARRRKSGGQA